MAKLLRVLSALAWCAASLCAIVVTTAGLRAQGTGSVSVGTITVSNAECRYNSSTNPNNSNCQGCRVDFGKVGNDPPYCWATWCDDNTYIGYMVCNPKQGKGPCVSNAVATQDCGSCESWKCSPIWPKDEVHPTPWCDIATCNCLDGGAHWTGSWQYVFLCPSS